MFPYWQNSFDFYPYYFCCLFLNFVDQFFVQSRIGISFWKSNVQIYILPKLYLYGGTISRISLMVQCCPQSIKVCCCFRLGHSNRCFTRSIEFDKKFSEISQELDWIFIGHFLSPYKASKVYLFGNIQSQEPSQSFWIWFSFKKHSFCYFFNFETLYLKKNVKKLVKKFVKQMHQKILKKFLKKKSSKWHGTSRNQH